MGIAFAVSRNKVARLLVGHPGKCVDIGQGYGSMVGQVVVDGIELVDEKVVFCLGTGNGQKWGSRLHAAGCKRRQVHAVVGNLPVVRLDIHSVQGTRLIEDLCVQSIRVVQEPQRSGAVGVM